MYCLDCSYNLRGIERGSCPECGRPYDAQNRESFAARPLPSSAKLSFFLAVGYAVGICTMPPIFLLLSEAQFFWIDLWHGTDTPTIIFGRRTRDGTIWSPYPIGAIALMVQHTLFFTISILIGILLKRWIAKQACR